ncbi:MAG TPA: Crp/Fnr family transcriptional regulator [Patescibacteria group bacterium]
MNPAVSVPSSLLLNTFFGKQRQKVFKKGQIILHVDNYNGDVFYLDSGFMKVYSLGVNGDERIYAFYKPQIIFPILYVFNNIKKEIVYEAMNNVTVKVAKKEEFLLYIKNDANALFETTQAIVNVLNIYVGRIDNLEFGKSYPRLIFRLLSLAKHFGLKAGEQITIKLPITHKDLANTLSITRETTSREIEVLLKKRLLKWEKRLFVIPNIKKLEKELEENY